MKYIAKAFDAYCDLETFIINGIEADIDDFVDLYDHMPCIGVEDQCCGDMRADIKDACGHEFSVLEDVKK
jgi:hypothetical protein